MKPNICSILQENVPLRNAHGKRHNGKGEKRGQCLGGVFPVDFLHVKDHHTSHNNKGGRDDRIEEIPIWRLVAAANHFNQGIKQER